MKKLLSTILALTIASSALACTGFGLNVVLAEEDVYAIGAIGATELLKQTLVPTTLPLADADSGEMAVIPLAETTTDAVGGATSEDEPIVAGDLDVVNRYLLMIETYLGANDGLSVDEVPSDRIEFSHRMDYTFSDLLGNNRTIVIYYDITSEETPADDNATTTTETPPTTDAPTTTEPTTTTTADATTAASTTATTDAVGGATKNARRSPQSDESTIVSSIVGVIVYGTAEYVFKGEKAVEDEETVYRMSSYADDLNYVRVVYKTDADGERKFFHEIYESGILVESSKTKVETTADGIEAELEFVEGSASGTFRFRIETEANVTEIVVDYETTGTDGREEEGAIHITATLDPATGTTTYTYVVTTAGEEEARYEHEREDDFDDDDDIDDDHQEDDEDEYEDDADDESDDDESEDDDSDDDESDDDESDDGVGGNF